ncbi:MAG TPA: SGNH/GDSL hydrolase family protein [Kiritimatiellia bacterium]|nr:SGNH/GDSL hydrolase family protein [Kiritimatiellia bacterium]
MPRLLIVGDSISVHYAPYLESRLRGRFECVKRADIESALANLDVPLGANWGDSTAVLERLRASRLPVIASADWALVNCGLHDVKRKTEQAECQVPLELYRANVADIASFFSGTATRLIWVNTTPVDDVRHAHLMKDFIRHERDCRAYNAAAAEVMAQRGIPVVDLHGFTLRLGPDVYCDHVHFTVSVRKKQAAHLAERLDQLAGASP